MDTRAILDDAPCLPSDLRWIAPLDRDRVTAITRRVYPDMHAWSKRFPASIRRRAVNMCLTWAAACPDAPLPLLGALSRWALATHAVDELVDAGSLNSRAAGETGTYDGEQLRELLELCARAAERQGRRGDPESPRHLPRGAAEPWRDLVEAVAECCRDIGALPGADRYHSMFARHNAGMFRAMVDELDWQRSLIAYRTFPSYAAYLRAGAATAGAPAGVAALLCGLPAGASDVSDALVEEIAFACGACVRLANDLRTYERELREEQKPSSVAILIHAHGASEEAACARVRAEQAQYRGRIAQRVAELPPALQGWGAWVERLEQVTSSLYEVQDYRDVSQALRRWTDAFEPAPAPLTTP